MSTRCVARAISFAAAGVLVGCSSPFDEPSGFDSAYGRSLPEGVLDIPRSVYRADDEAGGTEESVLTAGASAEAYVRYALEHSSEAEAAFQRWRAAAERLPQVKALPDPQITFGFFLDEVETRTGAQQSRLGVSQSFPWPGLLDDREDAASRAAASAWRTFEGVRLGIAERVVSKLHDLSYLDAAVVITSDTLELLQTFEGVLRARYRVGTGSHPELVRVQVELGLVEDQLIALQDMRPAVVAELNSELNRDPAAGVPEVGRLAGGVVIASAAELSKLSEESNPALLAIDERIEEQRILTDAARKEGLPATTIGLDYIVTDEAGGMGVAESGDDPILLKFGFTVPIWREKYDAGVREAIARRLSAAGERADLAYRLSAGIHRAWYEHTDADRRVRLYEETLIPKAEESLQASLAGFRAGDTSFLDLLDTERTLLEFAIQAERARADRGKGLARLETLVGLKVATDGSGAARPGSQPEGAQQ